jgi:hypothetical protein
MLVVGGEGGRVAFEVPRANTLVPGFNPTKESEHIPHSSADTKS